MRCGTINSARCCQSAAATFVLSINSDHIWSHNGRSAGWWLQPCWCRRHQSSTYKGKGKYAYTW